MAAVSWTGLQKDKLPLTHGVLARLLGVRRPSVTNWLGTLQKERAIKTTRGFIEVTDHERLEKICCRCYQTIIHEYGRVIGPRMDQKKGPKSLVDLTAGPS